MNNFRSANFESPLTARYRELEEQKKQKEEELARAEAAEPKIEFEEKTAAVLTKKVNFDHPIRNLFSPMILLDIENCLYFTCGYL